MNKTPPKGIYFVAVAFLAAGLLCSAQLLNVIFAALGIPPGPNIGTMKWVLTAYLLALFLVLYGVAMLVRLHPAPRWVFFAMTAYLMIDLAIAPAGNSPFYSQSRIYLNRILLMLPFVASCIYLFRLKRSELP